MNIIELEKKLKVEFEMLESYHGIAYEDDDEIDNAVSEIKRLLKSHGINVTEDYTEFDHLTVGQMVPVNVYIPAIGIIEESCKIISIYGKIHRDINAGIFKNLTVYSKKYDRNITITTSAITD